MWAIALFLPVWVWGSGSIILGIILPGELGQLGIIIGGIFLAGCVSISAGMLRNYMTMLVFLLFSATVVIVIGLKKIFLDRWVFSLWFLLVGLEFIPFHFNPTLLNNILYWTYFKIK